MPEVIDSLKSDKETKKDGRGGKRPNSGRKKSEKIKAVKDLKQQIEAHASGLVDVKKGDKIFKMSRLLALLEVLFTEAFNNKNIIAIKEYFDRTMGKARQPIEGTGENGEFIAKVIILPNRNETTNTLAGEQGATDNSAPSIAQ